LDYDYT